MARMRRICSFTDFLFSMVSDFMRLSGALICTDIPFAWGNPAPYKRKKISIKSKTQRKSVKDKIRRICYP